MATTYEILITGDGSPSIRLGSPEQATEAMHHSGGALSETAYVYYTAFEKTLELKAPPSALSVGLGLAYNEFFIVGGWLRRKIDLKSVYLESFEIDPNLRNGFQSWLNGVESESAFVIGETRLSDLFDQVLKLVGDKLDVDPNAIRSTLRTLSNSKQFQLRGALDSQTRFSVPFGLIDFDAFSQKATPTLWSEEFLHAFFSNVAAPTCVVATYAATGTLRRTLEAHKFTVERRPGFMGKRHSTLAYRQAAKDSVLLV